MCLRLQDLSVTSSSSWPQTRIKEKEMHCENKHCLNSLNPTACTEFSTASPSPEDRQQRSSQSAPSISQDQMNALIITENCSLAEYGASHLQFQPPCLSLGDQRKSEATGLLSKTLPKECMMYKARGASLSFFRRRVWWTRHGIVCCCSHNLK